MGRASWFIAALIVGKLLFSILLKISRGNILLLSTVAIIFLITYYLIPFNQYNIWQWQDALLAFVFLYSGYVYHQYKQKFQTINKPIYSLLLLTILILIKIYEYNNNLSTRNIAITNVPLFLVDTITWLVLITTLINYIPRCKIIEWTGEHSIVYYFLAGGCPLIVSLFLDKVGLDYDDYLCWRLFWYIRWLPYSPGSFINIFQSSQEKANYDQYVNYFSMPIDYTYFSIWYSFPRSSRLKHCDCQWRNAYMYNH